MRPSNRRKAKRANSIASPRSSRWPMAPPRRHRCSVPGPLRSPAAIRRSAGIGTNSDHIGGPDRCLLSWHVRSATQGAGIKEEPSVAKIDTKTEGLDLYVYVAKTFADSPWLHYGLWEPGEKPNIPQLRMAQERYVDKLLALIPPAPARLLDIGGGTGEMARLLLDKGYTVEMLTPSHLQAEVAAQKLGPNARVHESK